MSKELCKCGKVATWLYLPASNIKHPFYCDGCVPRGCTCNTYYVEQEEPDGDEGVDYKFLDSTKKSFVYLDEHGRGFPCCEFDYDEDGFDKD